MKISRVYDPCEARKLGFYEDEEESPETRCPCCDGEFNYLDKCKDCGEEKAS